MRTVWLASYPKSGNTWLRVLLANLLTDAPADINRLNSSQLATREIYDRAVGWETADFSADEFAALRLGVQESFAAQHPGALLKTHDAFLRPGDGAPQFSLRATRCAFYLLRNPLDVVVSLGHHLGLTVDASIAMLNAPDAGLRYAPNEVQLPQLLGDWSAHVAGWVDATGITVIPLRYEDLLEAPEATFAEACRRAGFSDDPARIAAAVARSSFQNLQRQEQERGFGERMTKRVFFRHGRAGTWRAVLTAGQVAAIVDRHGEVMRRFGYLAADGSIPA